MPRQLLNAARAREFELCNSEVLLPELLDALMRDKFALRLAQAGLAAHGLVDDLRSLAVVVSPVNVPRAVPTDPDDDHVLAAALTGVADLVASADKRDLLPLRSCVGIPIAWRRKPCSASLPGSAAAARVL
ncbi:PIN domain-containing protein [Variovorax sp. J22G73]|uniref:PIN domain-containing protein n=1 Tax=unclassified Variovorax TaxID=663243 RepID=UPI002577DC16|nr:MULTISPECIES: PIN domain-containing protein [unclassified Variovorax]MDM0010085.1 PIN domain-containing protein [Variovorax sp. J22R203]MDM0102593.1 PIN domain-containing protein [Variovorax sp. J22G73]